VLILTPAKGRHLTLYHGCVGFLTEILEVKGALSYWVLKAVHHWEFRYRELIPNSWVELFAALDNLLKAHLLPWWLP
jgi:hypothetical protein